MLTMYLMSNVADQFKPALDMVSITNKLLSLATPARLPLGRLLTRRLTLFHELTASAITNLGSNYLFSLPSTPFN